MVVRIGKILLDQYHLYILIIIFIFILSSKAIFSHYQGNLQPFSRPSSGLKYGVLSRNLFKPFPFTQPKHYQIALFYSEATSQLLHCFPIDKMEPDCLRVFNTQLLPFLHIVYHYFFVFRLPFSVCSSEFGKTSKQGKQKQTYLI